MKKIIVLCCVPFVLAIIFTSTMLYIPTRMDYPFSTVSGDKKYMDGIGFDATVQLDNFTNGVGSLRIDIKHRDGISTHQLRDHTLLQNEFIDEYKMEGSPQFRFEEKENSNTLNYYSSDETCKITKEELEEIPLTYNASLTKGNRSFYMKEQKDTEFTLQSELRLIKQPNDMLYKETTKCEDYEVTPNVQYTYVGENTQYSSLNDIIRVNDQTYYFMPSTFEHVEGQNKIYKINVTKDKGDSFTYTAKQNEFITLPMDRYYSRITLHNDVLYVSAYREGNLIMMCYDANGTLLQEVSLPRDEREEIGTIKVYQDYILMECEKSIIVYDCLNNAFIERIEKETLDTGYFDMIYKNGVLYRIIMKDTTQENQISEGTGIKSDINVSFFIQALKNGEVVYEGVQDIYHKKNVNAAQSYPLYIYDANFVEDEI